MGKSRETDLQMMGGRSRLYILLVVKPTYIWDKHRYEPFAVAN